MGKTVTKKYKYAVIASDVAIFSIRRGELNVLLIQMKKKPFLGMWAAPGGLVKGDESVDEAAVRILEEKTGIKDVYLEQLYTFGDVDRDPFGRVVSVAYMALIPSDRMELKTTSEYGGVEWFAVNGLPTLAYDHKRIIRAAVKRLRGKLEYSNIACNILPKEFTLSDLQRVYETVLDTRLDKRNFRKKILSLGLVRPLEKKRGGEAHRPAKLYAFTVRKPQIVNILK